jgi:sugar O-acyltransferase (sialic acid O-acetyltransferase NeuD family)
VIIFFGASGAARDIEYLLYEYYLLNNASFEVDFFVVPCSGTHSSLATEDKILLEEEFFYNLKAKWRDDLINVVIAIGNSTVRKSLYQKLSNYENLQFPTFIHPKVMYDARPGKVVIGDGNIIMGGTCLTSNIVIGVNNHINVNCNIAHDCVLMDHITISPRVSLAGNVTVNSTVFLGVGSVVSERVTICENVIVGAGSLVIKSIDEPGTYAGAPARKLESR